MLGIAFSHKSCFNPQLNDLHDSPNSQPFIHYLQYCIYSHIKMLYSQISRVLLHPNPRPFSLECNLVLFFTLKVLYSFLKAKKKPAGYFSGWFRVIFYFKKIDSISSNTRFAEMTPPEVFQIASLTRCIFPLLTASSFWNNGSLIHSSSIFVASPSPVS